MNKLFLIAVCLVVLASTASAFYNGGFLIDPVSEGAVSDGAPISVWHQGGLIDPAIEGGKGETTLTLPEDGEAPIKDFAPWGYPEGGEAISDW